MKGEINNNHSHTNIIITLIKREICTNNKKISEYEFLDNIIERNNPPCTCPYLCIADDHDHIWKRLNMKANKFYIADIDKDYLKIIDRANRLSQQIQSILCTQSYRKDVLCPKEGPSKGKGVIICRLINGECNNDMCQFECMCDDRNKLASEMFEHELVVNCVGNWSVNGKAVFYLED